MELCRRCHLWLKDFLQTQMLHQAVANYDFVSAYQATYEHNTPISSANAEQSFHRQVNTSKGIVFAEDLPKFDNVATSLRKQL